MKICSYCSGDSPIDAVYCINCGQLFQEAAIGETHRLFPAYDNISLPFIPTPTIRLSRKQINGLRLLGKVVTMNNNLFVEGHRIIPID